MKNGLFTKNKLLQPNKTKGRVMKLKFKLAATGVAALLASQTVVADTTVKMLSINTNADGEKPYFAAIEKAYETANPGVDVVIEYQDDESFKTRLPTLLQSDARPDLFFSWGGGVFQEQAKGGVLEDIGSKMPADCKAAHSAAALGAFAHNGVQHGMAMYAAEVVVWYNKDLAKKAGVDPTAITTWEEFLTAVKTAKDAGVTPIVVGGKDKWPLHFIYSMLAVRIAGADGIAAAAAGKDGGFENEAFVKVGAELERLANMEPFQAGFMDSGYDKATGLFGDGKGLFHIMGNWDYGASKGGSTSGEGLSDAQMGMIAFPSVAGGAGDSSATFGGVNGWLAAKGASQESIDFMCFMLNRENQTKAGAEGFWIPVAKGSSSKISNPFFAQISNNLAASSYHQLFLDQALGASVGGTVNDVSADLASGATTPDEAAARVEEARLLQ